MQKAAKSIHQAILKVFSLKMFSSPFFKAHSVGQMGLETNKQLWQLARDAMRTVWTMARTMVKVQLPSKVAIKEGWGTLLASMESVSREKRWRRSRGDGWLAAINKLKMLMMVRRLDLIKIQMCLDNVFSIKPGQILLFRLMVNVTLWKVCPGPWDISDNSARA